MLHSPNLKNFKIDLVRLNFHDSRILSVQFDEARRCEVKLDYYNWEGNQDNSSIWVRRRLKIYFDFLAVFRWFAPNFSNDSATISGVEYDIGISEILEGELRNKEEFNEYQSPIFDAENFLSIRFILNNIDLENDTEGYLHLVGSDVSIEWVW